MAAVFRWREREQRTLELLFVRRSINERDTWSGQVAFPGGKRQKTVLAGGDASPSAIKSSESDESIPWESPRETAQRETMEEIGLDLTASYVVPQCAGCVVWWFYCERPNSHSFYCLPGTCAGLGAFQRSRPICALSG